MLQEVWWNDEDRPSAFSIHWFTTAYHWVYKTQNKNIIGYISGSWVCHRALLLLLLWSWSLSPFLFSTIMSLYRNNQLSGWIVYLVEYSQTVIDVEGGMAPYVWNLVERPGGAFNFFPSHKLSCRCHSIIFTCSSTANWLPGLDIIAGSMPNIWYPASTWKPEVRYT